MLFLYDYSEISMISNVKINKKQNRRSEKFIHQLHFFFKVVSNIRYAFGTNHFTQQINITSAFYKV